MLPAGKWHDFWSGEAVGGDTELTVPASTEKIPVYVKAGSIIPWADVGLHATAPQARRITARVYGDGSLPFTVKDVNGTLRLGWNNGQGSIEGKSEFNIYAWEHFD